MSGPKREFEQTWPPADDPELDEDTALAMALFYDEGYDYPIPTYAEEQLAYLREQEKKRQAAGGEVPEKDDD